MGNKYILVIVDSLSSWMEAYPVINIEAKTTTDKIVMEFISHFGVPCPDQVRTRKASLPQTAASKMGRAIHGGQKIQHGLPGDDHLQSLKVILL